MKPSAFEKLIKGIFSAPINNTWANNKHLYIFSFYSKYFLFDIFNELILWKRYSSSIVAIFKKSILYWLLFSLVLFIWILLPFFRVSFFILLRLFWFSLWWWFYCSSFLSRWRGYFYFYLFGGITPNHYIADKNENFIIFEWLLNSFDSKINITNLGLINIIDIYFTFLNSFFTE